MTRAALALLLTFALLYTLGLVLFSGVARAGDDAPGAALWPEEPAYEATVHELAVIGPVDLMRDRPLCSLDHPCTRPSLVVPPMAPVPLPAPIYLLASAMVLMCALKGKRYV